jgi:hypothetical protein
LSGAGADQWDALRNVLRLPHVRRLELAWGLSLVGFFASTIALFVYAFEEGGATLVAIYGVARAAPGAIVTPALLGVTDRVPADRLLRATTAARAVLVALASAAVRLHASPAIVLTLASMSRHDGDVPAGPGGLFAGWRAPCGTDGGKRGRVDGGEHCRTRGAGVAGVVLAISGVGSVLSIAAAFLAAAFSRCGEYGFRRRAGCA